MSEDNQKLRSGCPPDYQIFWEKYFENNYSYKFFKDSILTLSFSNKHTVYHFGNLEQIAYHMVLKRGQSNTCRGQPDFKFWLSSDYQLSVGILLPWAYISYQFYEKKLISITVNVYIFGQLNFRTSGPMEHIRVS